jgi:DNA polymerase III gamma/tau subunit
MIVGHGRIVEQLKKLADGEQLSHGYIFFGPSMVGKRFVAVNFANFLECGKFAEPGILNDCLIISEDKNGTVGIDAVRQIKYFLWQKPVLSKKRTVILDNAESLTKEAQNALLKVTEEPPPSALLILITNDLDNMAETILSRLQKVYFSAVPVVPMAEWLEKELGLAKKEAQDLTRKSFGKPGLAMALAKNKTFKDKLALAEKLLNLPEIKRRESMKKLLESDDFDLSDALDSMIMILALQQPDNAAKIKRWHNFLRLRHEVAYFNLNPRLQLQNLLNSN